MEAVIHLDHMNLLTEGQLRPNQDSDRASEHSPCSGSPVYSEEGFVQLSFLWEVWMLVR